MKLLTGKKIKINIINKAIKIQHDLHLGLVCHILNKLRLYLNMNMFIISTFHNLCI